MDILVNQIPNHADALRAIRAAKKRVFGSEPINLVTTDRPDISFDLESDTGYRTLGPSQFHDTVFLLDKNGKKYRKEIGYWNAEVFVSNAFMRTYKPEMMHTFDDDVLFLDTETLDVEKLWEVDATTFFRLGQFAWGEGDVQITRDIDVIRDAIRSARLIIGHNLHSFDLSYLMGGDAVGLNVFDTMVHANLVTPAPYLFRTRRGSNLKSDKPETARRFYALDALCWTFGLDGKHGDLKEMARRHNCGIGEIPINDEYVAYAKQDIVSSRELARSYWSYAEPTEYEWREQELAAILAQIQRNGFRIDKSIARARVEELQNRKDELLAKLVRDYDFPTDGLKPWLSKSGKEAIATILTEHGVDLSDLPKTPKGATSFKGSALVEVTHGTDAEELGEELAELMGQRSLAQLALDSADAQGVCHTSITAFQRSGRFSVTKPGLTVWNSRGKGAIEKSYFVPDDGYDLLELDYSNADQRVVAGYSQDRAYMDVFNNDRDLHEMAGRAVYTNALYDTDPKTYRNSAKAMNHAYAYGAAAKTLSETTGSELEVAEKFVRERGRMFPRIGTWQQQVRNAAEKGWLINDWGRRMPVDRGREYTQAPALMGQSGTREIMVDALFRIRDRGLLSYVRVIVHDAIVAVVPHADRDSVRDGLVAAMETRWRNVDFPVSHGGYGANWYDAGH
jgi:DNA polymerase-1